MIRILTLFRTLRVFLARTAPFLGRTAPLLDLGSAHEDARSLATLARMRTLRRLTRAARMSTLGRKRRSAFSMSQNPHFFLLPLLGRTAPLTTLARLVGLNPKTAGIQPEFI